MKREQITERLLEERLIAIVRLSAFSEVASVLEDLVSGGMNALEITANTPGYSEAIAAARLAYKGTDVLIGAGTITSPDLAEKAIGNGAQFIVTPNTDPKIIKVAHQHEVPVVMGAFTPSEVSVALNNGADLIKFFPAQSIGIGFFQAIRAPLNNARFFVVGGVNLKNCQEWAAAGAAGFGLGSILTDHKTHQARIDMAKEFVKIKNQLTWIN